MQAIRTRYHSSTNIKGARISAKCEAATVFVPYNHAIGLFENHAAAARALRDKLQWNTPYYKTMYGGEFDRDHYWVSTVSWRSIDWDQS